MDVQLNEVRHGISRERLEQLIDELDKREDRGLRAAWKMIESAGVASGYTWLMQCLLYEPVESVWQAWNAPEVG